MNRSVPQMAADLFEKLSWPDTTEEEWRRTDLSRLLPKGMLDKTADLPILGTGDINERPAPLLPENYAARVITERGIPVAMALSEEAVKKGLSIQWVSQDSSPEDFPTDLERSANAELNTETDRITAWHWRSFPGALHISLSESVRLKEPVIIEEKLIAGDEQSPLFSAPHLHIALPGSGELNLLWCFDGAPEVQESVIPVVNAGLTASLGENSLLNIALNQNLGNGVVFFLHDHLLLERDSRLEFTEAHFGGRLVKTRGRVILSGKGSEARINGLYLAEEDSHKDIGTIQNHLSPGASSTALYKGAIHPGGRSVYHGLIEVSPEAQGTDAYLTNRNLVLGEGARADSIPQLNILTDDVKCSHGSTTGKMDPSHLFYLESRGFSPVEAKKELTRGFLTEAMNLVPDTLADVFTDSLDGKL